MAQWIRRWSTEPEILGSIPSGVGFFFFALLKFNRDKECAHAELTFAPERKQGTQLINLVVP